MNGTMWKVMVLAVSVAMVGPAAAEPAEAVRIVKQVFKKGGSNTAGVADLTIANNNDYAVKDLKIRCLFTARDSGKVSEIQQTIAGPVKAKSEQLFKKVNFAFVDLSKVDGACDVRAATPG
jgi:hypothetical protein